MFHWEEKEIAVFKDEGIKSGFNRNEGRNKNDTEAFNYVGVQNY